MNVLKIVDDLIAKMATKGAAIDEILAAVKAIIHSPITGFIVARTRTKADDAILETLKTLFPQ